MGQLLEHWNKYRGNNNKLHGISRAYLTATHILPNSLFKILNLLYNMNHHILAMDINIYSTICFQMTITKLQHILQAAHSHLHPSISSRQPSLSHTQPRKQPPFASLKAPSMQGERLEIHCYSRLIPNLLHVWLSCSGTITNMGSV